MSQLSTWRRAARLVFDASPLGMSAIVALFVLQGTALGFGLEFLRRLVNDLIDGSATRSELLPLVVGTAALLAATQVAGSLAAQIRLVVSERVTQRSIIHFLGLAGTVDYEEFLRPEFHDRFSLARQGAAGSAWNVVFGMVQLVSALPPLVAVTVVIARIDPALAIILGMAEAPLVLATWWSAKLMRSLSARLAANDRERSQIFRILTGKNEAAELRIHDLSAALGRRHDELTRLRLDEVEQLAKRRASVSLAGSAVSAIGLGLALVYVIDRAIDGAVTVGDAGIAVLALQQLGNRLRSASQGVGALVEQSFFIEFLFDGTLASRAPVMPSSAPFTGVTLSGICYRYPRAESLALDSIDLEIEPGMLLAVTGPNGAGKTTLFGLLQGILTPEAGTIEWHSGAAPFRSALMQDPIRFELGVGEVIALGRADEPLDEDRARWALEMVGLGQHLDLGDRLGAGFEGGRDLSGGQWQRLAVARALYRGGDFILLDEPGSHLDPDAELALFEHLRRYVDTTASTVVVVTHRASTLRFADRVLLIDRGRITCDVPGASSLQAPPLAELFASQLL